MTENGSGRGAGTASKYKPRDSYVVMFRFLKEKDYSEPQLRHTEEYWALYCAGCDQPTLRIYKDTGRILCTNESCEKVLNQSKPLFTVAADLCGYDRQEDKPKIRERIQYELDEDDRIRREREKKEKERLEGEVERLNGELEEAEYRADAHSQATDYWQEKAEGWQKWYEDAQAELESRQSKQARYEGPLVGAGVLVAAFTWLTALNARVGATLGLGWLLALLGVATVLGLMAYGTYQEAVRRAEEQGRPWVPLVRRLDKDRLLEGTLKLLMFFLVPYLVAPVLVGWLSGFERFSGWLAAQSLELHLIGTAAAVILAVLAFCWSGWRR